MFKLYKIAASLLALEMIVMSATDVAAQNVIANKQYVYVLRLAPRLHEQKDWTERDNAAVSEHFKRLQQASLEGKVILAGRTAEPLPKTFGLVVFEAADDTAAREFMESDPAIAAGVMSATLHPYSVALLRK